MLEVLTPRVQDAEQSNVSSQVPGVAGDLKECRGTGAEEQVVEQPLVLQHQCGQLMGQSEDDVEVRHGQQLGGTRCQPSGACVALTLGAVPVAARVIGDGLMPAAGASIAMTAKSRRAATDDGVHHLAVLRGEMRSMPLEEAAAGSTEDVCLSRDVMLTDREVSDLVRYRTLRATVNGLQERAFRHLAGSHLIEFDQ